MNAVLNIFHFEIKLAYLFIFYEFLKFEVKGLYKMNAENQ